MREMQKTLKQNIIFDFFILDNNLTPYLKGTEVAEYVMLTYHMYYQDKFDQLFFHFIFATDDPLNVKK